jgi:outer membrane protein assembly factor BamE (lipoprotein component of BamABCDE complex)
MKQVLVLILTASVLSACANSGNQLIKDQSEASVEQKIHKGVSTQRDVRAAFGDPSSTSFTDNGNQLWNYEYARATPEAKDFIPVVNLFGTTADVNKKTLVVFFDANGVVKNFTLSSSQQQVNRGLFD